MSVHIYFHQEFHWCCTNLIKQTRKMSFTSNHYRSSVILPEMTIILTPTCSESIYIIILNFIFIQLVYRTHSFHRRRDISDSSMTIVKKNELKHRRHFPSFCLIHRKTFLLCPKVTEFNIHTVFNSSL